MAIEIEEHYEDQRLFWTIQRIGLALLGLTLLAAALGLLGGRGPLHEATAGAGTALEVRYPRVQRMATGLTLDVRMRPAPGQATASEATASEATTLALPATFFRDHRVESWTPSPDRGQATGGTMRFEFPPTERILLHATALSPGPKSLDLRAGNGASRRIDYLVLP